MFNNIVHFRPEPVTAEVCAPPRAASAGNRWVATQETPDLSNASPAPDSSPAPTSEPPAPDTVAPTSDATTTSGATAGPSDVVEDGATTPPPLGPAPSDPAAGPTDVDNSDPAEPVASEADATTTETVGPAPTPETPTRVARLSAPTDVAPQAAVVTPPTITSVRHPEFAAALYDRLGPIEVRGTAPGLAADAQVTVELRDATGKVRSSTSVPTVADGAYVARLAGGFAGKATVVVTGSGTASLAVDLLPARLTQTSPTQLDPIAPASITGRMTPAIPGTTVTARVKQGTNWRTVSYGTVRAGGTYAIPYSYRTAKLGPETVQVCATTAWGAAIASDAAAILNRIRAANPVITNTVADEVAATFRAGCTVGPSRLSTIRINQQDMQGNIYRGEIVVRRDRAADVADVFSRTFEAGFPIHQMKEVSAFGATTSAPWRPTTPPVTTAAASWATRTPCRPTPTASRST